MKKIKFVALLLLLTSVLEAKAADILIEAENLTEYGGWVMDNQSMSQMGSPYLLAHGMGVPVKDAMGYFNVERTGLYHVWVRTRDWVKSWGKTGSPGRFHVLINGFPCDSVFGTTTSEWNWQDGGVVYLREGENKVALHDLTGFEGRCDAICLVEGKDGKAPVNTMIELNALRRKMLGLETPLEAGEYDLVVVGGGVAGCCTAVTAARLGCKVALIHNRPVLGGNNSSEVRVGLSGRIFQNPYPALGTLLDEIGNVGHWTNVEAKENPTTVRSKLILQTLKEHPEKLQHNAGPASNYEDGRKLFVVQQEENITLFLNMQAISAEMQDDEIASVVAKDNSTGKEYLIHGRLFADCTGDGNLGYMAGADYRMGRESKSMTGEADAPEAEDSLTMGMSVQWYTSETSSASSFPDCPWAVQLKENNCIPVTRGDWDWETGLWRDQVAEAEFIRDYGLRAVYGNWDYLKNHYSKKEQYANRKLEWVAYIGGKRESRRLLGDVILREEDILNSVSYEDASFTITWEIDIHYPKTIAGLDEESFLATNKAPKIRPYPVPYRCLYSRNVNNLFMAGRDISVTHLALGSVRVMRTCGMMGEVVGMAASLCKKYGANPRAIYTTYFSELRKLMTAGIGVELGSEGNLNATGPALPEPEKEEPVTIMGIGNSITEGGDAFTSYLYPLWKMLDEDGYNFEFIGPQNRLYDVGTIHSCGFSGRTAEWLADNMATWYKAYPADVVLLHAGHNHFVDETPVPGIVKAYRRIIQTIQSINPEAEILVGSVVNAGKLPKYAYIPQLNVEIRALVDELNDSHVHFVDVAGAFDWETCTVDDKVHPNAKGAQIMANAWFEKLQDLGKLYSPVVQENEKPSLYILGNRVMPGEMTDLGLYLRNMDDVTSFETSFLLPEGVSLLDVKKSTSCASDHIITVKGQGHSTFELRCNSPTGSTFSGIFGRIATLSVQISETVQEGSYPLYVSGSSLIKNNGEVVIPSASRSTICIGSDTTVGGSDPVILSEMPPIQAYTLRHVDSGLFLCLHGPSKTVTVEKESVENGSIFFLEPAIDWGDGFFRLRSLDRTFLCSTPSGGMYYLTADETPNETSVFRITETGDRLNLLSVAESPWRLKAEGGNVGSALTVSTGWTGTTWQIIPNEADVVPLIKRLITPASTLLGLTNSNADRDLRQAIHDLKVACDQQAGKAVLNAVMTSLICAAREARKSYEANDTSMADTIWGKADPIPKGSFVAYVELPFGERRYLTCIDKGFGLSEAFSAVQPETDGIQDLFYNPLTDRYAIRAKGNDTSGMGAYLTCDGTGSMLMQNFSDIPNESVRIWNILPLNEAISRLLTLSGKCEDDTEWRFDVETKTLYITGMCRLSEENVMPWQLLAPFVEKAIVAGNVSYLPSRMFSGCTTLMELEMAIPVFPTIGADVFFGVNEGLLIRSAFPEQWSELPLKVQSLPFVKIADKYVYQGTPPTLQTKSIYESSAVSNDMQIDVGSYVSNATVTVTVEDFSFSYDTQFSYTITPAVLVVTTNNYTRAYGASNPIMRAQYQGLVNGEKATSVIVEQPEITCEADKRSPVGTYTITLSGGKAKNGNYSFEYVPSILTVRAANLSVIVNDTTRVYGEPNPAFTYKCKGFVNDEDYSVFTEQPVFSCEADEESEPGEYTITISGGVAPNYLLRYAAGVLRITNRVSVPHIEIKPKPDVDVSYDLSGRMIHAPQREYGFCIRNGKKSLIW